MESHYYNVTIQWSKDRRGMMCSPELKESSTPANGCIEVATPPEFPKGIAGIWSPEHLLTASVVSCFMTTFLAIAENFKLAEDRSMAGMQFKFYQQFVDQVPVKNGGVRIWSNESTEDFIQMVAFLQNPETPGMQMTRKKLNLLNTPLIKESRWSLSSVLNMTKGDLKKVVNFSQAVNW